jgi:hypothetical protein
LIIDKKIATIHLIITGACMKAVIFIMLLLQTIHSQQDPLLNAYLEISAHSVNTSVQNTEGFFQKFSADSENDPAAMYPDTAEVFYFDIAFSNELEYNYLANLLNVNFNYIVVDRFCNNSNRNGILLLEKGERTAAAKNQYEKHDQTFFVLIPDKCSTTRFYNSKKEMFCDNKKQFSMNYDEGTRTAENLKVRVGIQLLSNSRVDYYDRITAGVKDYPVDTHIKEYVLRCCIRSIVFIRGEEIMENYVSLK